MHSLWAGTAEPACESGSVAERRRQTEKDRSEYMLY